VDTLTNNSLTPYTFHIMDQCTQEKALELNPCIKEAEAYLRLLKKEKK